MIRAVLILLLLALALPAEAAVRIKDIAALQGQRDNQLVGYGLVVGLLGTGDTLRNSTFTEQSIQSMLEKLGINTKGALRTRNVAAVLVTADLPALIARGSRMDVTVSSMGDATSLLGGTLILTPLAGPDGVTYAVAQGQVSVSGFAATGQAETLTQGVPTAARISNGALIERELPRRLGEAPILTLELKNPDFKTSIQITDAINAYTLSRYGERLARERDYRSVALVRPHGVGEARFMAEIGDLRVDPDVPARVVIDSRSGTVVIGRDVQVSTVAVTHGNLTVRITETPNVSQPKPFSQGKTVVTPQTAVSADQTGGQVAIIEGASLRTLVRGLNQIGVKPSGIIAILQAIKSSGALQAELVVQ